MQANTSRSINSTCRVSWVQLLFRIRAIYIRMFSRRWKFLRKWCSKLNPSNCTSSLRKIHSICLSLNYTPKGSPWTCLLILEVQWWLEISLLGSTTSTIIYSGGNRWLSLLIWGGMSRKMTKNSKILNCRWPTIYTSIFLAKMLSVWRSVSKQLTTS